MTAILKDCPVPLECYCDSGSEAKAALLKDFGFRQEAVSVFALRSGDLTRDLVVIART